MNFNGWCTEYQPRLADGFNQYVNQYQSNASIIQKNLDLKRDHSLRVMQEMRFLAMDFNLGPDRIAFAESLGLLHDIGRFEQYIKYKTFFDLISENHGKLGVNILIREKILDGVDKEIQHLICYAIENHNAKKLPVHPCHETIFFSQLLRDADKLDIFHVVTTYYECPDPETNDAILLNLPNIPKYSEHAIMELIQGEMVSSEHINCQNDFKLMQLGWIFDVNFPKTLSVIRERKIIEKIANVLPDTEDIDKIILKLNQSIDQRLHNTSMQSWISS